MLQMPQPVDGGAPLLQMFARKYQRLAAEHSGKGAVFLEIMGDETVETRVRSPTCSPTCMRLLHVHLPVPAPHQRVLQNVVAGFSCTTRHGSERANESVPFLLRAEAHDQHLHVTAWQ